jgi:SAM-dependent methyltransferase
MVIGEPERGETTAMPLNVTYRVGRISKHLSGRWLDFGCADGGYDAELLARGATAVSGVDVEESRIVQAKRRDVPNTEYATFDGHSLPFGDAHFDGVFMNEVFEHVADEERVLAEIRRVLKPGGRLALISPNRWFPVDGHTVRVGSRSMTPAPLIPWLPERLTRNWTTARNYWPGQLQRQVNDAGFAIAEVGFIWPVLEKIRWLPPRATARYQQYIQTMDRLPVLRRFGLSTMVIGVKPAVA